MAKKAPIKPHNVVLQRCGDFYESHQDMPDIEVIYFAGCVGIFVTNRNGRVITGFPFHCLDTYVAKVMAHHKESCVTIHDSQGVRLITLNEDGSYRVRKLVSNQSETTTNNNSKNNNVMENNSFNTNFKAYDFNNGFIMFNGAYKECECVGCIHHYDADDENATQYRIKVAGLDDVQVLNHADLKNRLYYSKTDIEEARPMEPRELTIRSRSINGQRGVLDADRKAYFIIDGQLHHAIIMPTAYDVKTEMFIKDNCEDVKFYLTKDDALAFNTIEVHREDGTTETIGGEWNEAMPTPEQQVLIDQLQDLFAKMKEAKVGIAFDRDNCTFEAYNADKAYIEYDGSDVSNLNGWHLPTIKGANVYDYNGDESLYHVHLYSKEVKE